MHDGEHVMWKQSRLRPGDELRVKIVEAEAAGKPSKRIPRDHFAEEKTKKRYPADQLRRRVSPQQNQLFPAL
jgi:protein involved in polysaccharide export with SLBB domain